MSTPLAFGTWKHSSSLLILDIYFKGCFQDLYKHLLLAFPLHSKIPLASSLIRAPPIAIYSSILAWRVPWTEETGGLESMRLQESDMT